LERVHEIPGFVTCDNISEKIHIIICYADEITTDSYAAVTQFLHHYSQYDVLADVNNFTS